MVKSIAFVAEATSINEVLIFPGRFLRLRGSPSLQLTLLIDSFLLANPALEPVVPELAVRTKLIYSPGLLPHRKVHLVLFQFISVWGF